MSCATCVLCEASCGLIVEHDRERIHAVRGDPDDELSRGYICPKGVALVDVQHDPDRLRKPLRKDGAGWREIEWPEALDLVADRLAAIQDQHGRDAVATYTGNPTIHNYGTVLFSQFLARAIATRNHYSSVSVDTLPRVLTSFLMYGSQAILPIPDIDRTQHMLIIGANPAVSNGSVMTAPDCKTRLKDIQGRGGRVVVIDPRRTETARLANEHHFIRPGTDALLLLAMLHTIFAENLAQPKDLAKWLDGWDEAREVTRDFAPDRVAPVVGIAGEDIARLARDFARSPAAVCYGRMGTCTQRFGAVTSWLIDVLNIVTGNLDRPGGAMFPKGAVDLPALAVKLGQNGSFNRFQSRVSGLPEFDGQLPVAAFAEEMETPGEGQIRALVTNAGNPALSLPNGRRLERAFAKLDFMVSIDIYLNETTRHADIILPPTWGLENDYYPLLFGSLAVRNHAKYSPALIEPAGDTRPDWKIMLELARRIDRRRSGQLAKRMKNRLVHSAASWLTPRGMLGLALRFGSYRGVTLSKLEKAPHGVDLGPLEPRLPDMIRTESGAIQLAPKAMTNDIPRVRELLATARDGGLIVIGRRSLRSNNSWMHNSPRLVKGKERCVLLMHPDDAASRGLGSGDRARIVTATGEIIAPIEVSDQVMPGVVSLPHGWGHDREGVRLRVAGQKPGVSLNDVMDDAAIDPLSGVTHFNGVAVQVEAIGNAESADSSEQQPSRVAL